MLIISLKQLQLSIKTRHTQTHTLALVDERTMRSNSSQSCLLLDIFCLHFDMFKWGENGRKRVQCTNALVRTHRDRNCRMQKANKLNWKKKCTKSYYFIFIYFVVLFLSFIISRLLFRVSIGLENEMSRTEEAKERQKRHKSQQNGNWIY